jgi:gamma-glutamylcysteine synthetase
LSQLTPFDQVLTHLQDIAPSALRFSRGIEKEGLRVNDDAHINQNPHPSALGSTLTHPHITTDYSESLLEFITPVVQNADDVLSFLDESQRFSYQHLGQQYIWPASIVMACGIATVARCSVLQGCIITFQCLMNYGKPLRIGKVKP